MPRFPFRFSSSVQLEVWRVKDADKFHVQRLVKTRRYWSEKLNFYCLYVATSDDLRGDSLTSQQNFCMR